jgi:hypothetical protein
MSPNVRATPVKNRFICSNCFAHDDSPPNEKLTDDEERANDARIGTGG